MHITDGVTGTSVSARLTLLRPIGAHESLTAAQLR